MRGSKKVRKSAQPTPVQTRKKTPKTSPKQKTDSQLTRATDHSPKDPTKSTSSDRKDDVSVVSKDSSGHKSNGKIVSNNHRKMPNARATPPANSAPDSDSTTATYHSNNSNNSQINGKPKKAHNHRPEPFVPSILGRVSSSSYDTHSMDSNSSPTRKVVPTWNVPSGEQYNKKSSNTLRPKKDNSPLLYNSLAPYSQTMSRKKSQSSDYLRESGSSTLKVR